MNSVQGGPNFAENKTKNNLVQDREPRLLYKVWMLQVSPSCYFKKFSYTILDYKPLLIKYKLFIGTEHSRTFTFTRQIFFQKLGTKKYILIARLVTSWQKLSITPSLDIYNIKILNKSKTVNNETTKPQDKRNSRSKKSTQCNAVKYQHIFKIVS